VIAGSGIITSEQVTMLEMIIGNQWSTPVVGSFYDQQVLVPAFDVGYRCPLLTTYIMDHSASLRNGMGDSLHLRLPSLRASEALIL
jgi:hypothetical protein